MSEYSSDGEGGVCIGVRAEVPVPVVNETPAERFNRRRRAREAENPQRMRHVDDAAQTRFAERRKRPDDATAAAAAVAVAEKAKGPLGDAAKDDTRVRARGRGRERERSRERGRERERERGHRHQRQRQREHTYSACHVCRAAVDTNDTAPGNVVLCNGCRIPYMVGANDCRLYCARAENMQLSQVVQVAEQRMTECYNAVFGQRQQQQYDPVDEPPVEDLYGGM